MRSSHILGFDLVTFILQWLSCFFCWLLYAFWEYFRYTNTTLGSCIRLDVLFFFFLQNCIFYGTSISGQTKKKTKSANRWMQLIAWMSKDQYLCSRNVLRKVNHIISWSYWAKQGSQFLLKTWWLLYGFVNFFVFFFLFFFPAEKRENESKCSARRLDYVNTK